jgi:hypothetical protein
MTRKKTDHRNTERPLLASQSLIHLIQNNALLQGKSQLQLMYSNFQTEMPCDGMTGIATWLESRLREHGMPSLIRFGPRSRPQVLRRDEFSQWFASITTQPARSSH